MVVQNPTNMVSKISCGRNLYNDVGHLDLLTDIIVVQIYFAQFRGDFTLLRKK